MNRAKTFLFFLCLPVAFIACQKKDEKKEDTVTAPSTICLSQPCDNSEYNNYRNQGFSSYDTSRWGGSYFVALNSGNMGNTYSGYSYNGYNGNNMANWGQFCSCQDQNYASVPVYHPVRGMGCVTTAALQQFGNSVVYWTLPQGQQAFATFSAASANAYFANNGNQYGYNYTCPNFVAEACHVNQVDSCRNSDSVCRPTAQGSALGVCTRQ